MSIKELIAYKLSQETFIEVIRRQPVTTPFGTFEGVWLRSKIDQREDFAIVKGSDFANNIVDVRVQKQHPIHDVFLDPLASLVDDIPNSKHQIDYALKMLSAVSHGVFVYLSSHKTFAHSEKKIMDPREYGIGAQILRALEVNKMRMHVSSPKQLVALEGFGLQIDSIIEMAPTP